MTRILGGTDSQAPMAIDDSIVVFPNNVQGTLVDTMVGTFPNGLSYFKRRLRQSDPNESIGVTPVIWLPEADSYEFRGTPVLASEPTVNRYTILIEAFVKDGDEERGLARHSVLAKLVRAMLYSSQTLAISLRALSVTLYGSTETLSKYGVTAQRYISNEISGSWLYLSTTEFWFETTTN